VRRLAGILVVTALLAGCIASGEPAPAQPQPCRQLFNAVRCLAMIDSAAAQLKTTREDITAIDVIPEPTPETRDGETILEARSGGPPIDVRVTLADGSTKGLSMNCGGIAAMSNPACMDEPHLSVYSVTGGSGGYHDIPCVGEAPVDCATPVPTIEPAVAAEARALTIGRLDVPLDHVGPYEVHVGEATIPNGILTTAAFALVDDWPPGVTMTSGAVSLLIRSLEADGKPFGNTYEHGWRAGVERVEAILVFTVDRFDPGATLAIRDVVVR
jgi:hypothetical protein